MFFSIFLFGNGNGCKPPCGPRYNKNLSQASHNWKADANAILVCLAQIYGEQKPDIYRCFSRERL